LVEIAGDSALIFPARDATGLASGLQQLFAHPDERLARRQRGLAHVQAFTWRRTAEQTLAVYRRMR
ncbi:MAG: glycosyltransferase, partial [Caldilineaceae bacterium]|nr:glycosyltransferase [Caldilineaceae bacterium]